MTSKIKVAVVGLGKMGLSHFALVNAHPDVEAVACDSSGLLTDVLSRNIPSKVYRDYAAMLEQEPLDAVVIATPSRHHAAMVRMALERKLHVFCEKPFTLNWQDAEALADMAEQAGLVNQVGYHCRFVGAFRHMYELLAAGALGRVSQVVAEAYGPVVLRSKRKTWRTQKEEGGGCLYDYAAHPINLLNWCFGLPIEVSGSHLNSVFSERIDDAVVSTLRFAGGETAMLSVNWSDESHRKMSTAISMIGTNGRINADRQECQIYLRQEVPGVRDLKPGWTVKYTTDLTQEAWFYLRGEEYSHQVDAFIQSVMGAGGTPAAVNSFRTAAETDRTMAMIQQNASSGAPERTAMPKRDPEPVSSQAPRRRGWFGRASV